MTTRRKVLLGGAGVLALGVGGLSGRRLWLDREPAALPATDAQGRVVWQNPRAADLLGRDGREEGGRTLASLSSTVVFAICST